MQTLHINSTLQGGKYRIISVLGQGGFGITYLAEQVMLGRKVAIKEFFYKECCDREEGTSHVTLGTQSNRETVKRFMNKFLKEARTISQLDHPNIIKIHDIFEENNTAYYVMEYIEGENLSEMVKCQGALPEATAVAYIKKVANALAYIHARSINHLDVKPGNIMLRKHDQQIVLIDFGLSKQYDDVGSQTSSTPIGVSHGFAPIEQYSPAGITQFSPQTDIYSLGATLYWLVIGKTPPSAHDVLSDGLPQMPMSLSSSVQKMIKCAMQVKKSDRPNHVDALICMLGKENPEENTSNRKVEVEEETKIISAKREPEVPAEKDYALQRKEDNEIKKMQTSRRRLLYIVGGTIVCVALIIVLIIQCSKDEEPEMIPQEQTLIVNGEVENDTILLSAIPSKEEKVVDTQFFKNVKVNKESIPSDAYMIYFGTLKDGLPNGKGKAIFSDGREYVGSFKEGVFNDEKGVLITPDGLKYEGTFVDGFISEGKYTLQADGKVEEVYVGNFVNYSPCTGTFYDGNGNKTLSLQHGKVTKVYEDLNKTNSKDTQKHENVRDVKPIKSEDPVTASTPSDVPEPEDNQIYEKPDQLPSFVGGDEALAEYIRLRLKYPSSALENNIEGKVTVSFVVEKNGSLSNIKILRSADPALDKEAYRVVQSMPNFIPGKNNGKVVRTAMYIPITFRLQ